MSESETEIQTEEAEVPTETNREDEPTTQAPPPPSEAKSGVAVKTPEFMALHERGAPTDSASMERFYDVQVSVWAELGRVEMSLGDLMQLSEGSVLRLNRPVGDLVDLVSQGVKLARGEVVVVDDSFAIRIREILSTEK